MKKVVLSPFYNQPWKILPLTFLSPTKVCFGEDSRIDFNFTSGVVVLFRASIPKEIARLESDKARATSIAEFRGIILGDYFTLSIRNGSFFGSPAIELKVLDAHQSTHEIRYDQVQMLRDFDFGGFVRGRYIDGQEKLEIVYEAEVEDLAQVIGAVLLHLLIEGCNTRGAQ